MRRYIDITDIEIPSDDNNYDELVEFADAIAEQEIMELPERKKGKWTIKTGELAIWDVCSECKKMVIHKAPFYNYCPNCGCDMREGEQSEIN